MPKKIFNKLITVKKNKQILLVKKDRHVISFRLPVEKAFRLRDCLQKEGLTVTQVGRILFDGFCDGSIKIGGNSVIQKR